MRPLPTLALAALLAACSKKPDTTPAPPDTTAPPADTSAPVEDAAPPTPVDTAAAPPDATMQPPDSAPAAVADTGPAPDISSAGLPPMQLPDGAITVTGFSQPASVFFIDEVGKPDWYIVASVNGDPLDKDDNGFLSKVNADGTIAALKWIDGDSKDVMLDAPKGMALDAKGVLWVADIKVMRRFDPKTGKQLADYPIPGARNLTDIAQSLNHGLFISDSGLDKTGEPTKAAAIWRVYENDPEAIRLETGESIGCPSTIAAVPGALAWVGFDASRKLHRTNIPDQKLIERSIDLGADAGMLSGVAWGLSGRDSESYFVASQEKHALIEVVEPAEGPLQVKTLLENIKGPGDFAFTADHLIALPVVEENLVVIFRPKLTQLPIPATWDALAKLLADAQQLDRKSRITALVDDAWGVYLYVQASMVGPGIELDDGGNELPKRDLKLPQGKWFTSKQLLDGHDDDATYYAFFEPIEMILGQLDGGDSSCTAASLHCGMGLHPTGVDLQFAKNKAGDTKLVGVFLYDSPPDEEVIPAARKRFSDAVAKKIK